MQNDKKHRPAAKQESKAGPERQASDERRAQNPGKWELGGDLERINHRKRNPCTYVGTRPEYGLGGTLTAGL